MSKSLVFAKGKSSTISSGFGGGLGKNTDPGDIKEIILAENGFTRDSYRYGRIISAVGNPAEARMEFDNEVNEKAMIISTNAIKDYGKLVAAGLSPKDASAVAKEKANAVFAAELLILQTLYPEVADSNLLTQSAVQKKFIGTPSKRKDISQTQEEGQGESKDM